MINQKQMVNVEYFKFLDSVIKMMQKVHMKLNLGFPMLKQHSTETHLFSPANWA